MLVYGVGLDVGSRNLYKEFTCELQFATWHHEHSFVAPQLNLRYYERSETFSRHREGEREKGKEGARERG